MSLEFVFGDELLELEIVNNDPWALAQREGVTILSDKDLLASVVDTDEGMVIAAVFNAANPEHYSFDTVVDHRYQHQGLGKQLIEIAMGGFEDMKEAYPDMKINLEVINPDIIPHLKNTYGLEVTEEIPGRTFLGNAIRMLIADVIVDPNYDYGWELDDYLVERSTAIERVRETLEVGAEYASRSEEYFGVFLKEMSTDFPYRISWYDERGFSGHAEIASKEDAINQLVSELGYGVHPAPGSLDRLFQTWPTSDRLTAHRILAQLRRVAQHTLNLSLEQLRAQMAQAAQAVYDEWEQDEEGMDEEFGSGGICDQISSALASVIVTALEGVEIAEGGHDGDDHAWLIAYNHNEAYAVDIPHQMYEAGGGYSWTKVPDVQFTPEDVTIDSIPVEWIQPLGE